MDTHRATENGNEPSRVATPTSIRYVLAASALRDAGYHVDFTQLTGADHYAPIFHEVRNGQFQVVTTDAAGQRAVQVVLDAIATRQHASSEQ